jgi:hypothetical protein
MILSDHVSVEKEYPREDTYRPCLVPVSPDDVRQAFMSWDQQQEWFSAK